MPECDTSHMGDIVTVQLDAALSEAVARLARRKRKSREAIAREALLELVQSERDYQAVLAFRRRPGKTVSLEALKRRYGCFGTQVAIVRFWPIATWRKTTHRSHSTSTAGHRMKSAARSRK